MTARLAPAAAALALIGLLAWFGVRAIGRDVWQAAWAIPLLVALHAVQLGLSAVAWRGLCGAAVPGLGGWWRIRWIREAVNSMLPVAQLGGNVVGIRLLAAAGLGQAEVASGTVLDVAMEATGQAILTLAALATLASALPDRRFLATVAAAAALACLAVAGLAVALRLGALRLVEAGARRAAALLPGLDLAGLQDAFTRRARRRRPIAAALALHLLAYALGVAETWLGLAAMGARPGIAAAFVIESLGLAVRGAAFAVPAGLAAQEAGFVLIGGLFGLPATVCVALSMLKRAREVTVGATGLLAWHRLEFARRHVRATAAATMRSSVSATRDAPP